MNRKEFTKTFRMILGWLIHNISAVIEVKGLNHVVTVLSLSETVALS